MSILQGKKIWRQKDALRVKSILWSKNNLETRRCLKAGEYLMIEITQRQRDISRIKNTLQCRNDLETGRLRVKSTLQSNITIRLRNMVITCAC